MATDIRNQSALARANGANGRRANGNGPAALAPAPATTAAPATGDARPREIAAGDAATPKPSRLSLRDWLRVAQIARVMGTLGLYLFLENYGPRAKFYERLSARRLEEAAKTGGAELRRARRLEFKRRVLDAVVRAVRYAVFRGADESGAKGARLEKQAAWLKRSLVRLGPTFIKIGQALATRADLLPLAYVKELTTLQDQVPPFPNAEAFARVEAELGRSIAEAYAEMDAEPVAAASLGQVYRARLHTGEEVAVKVQRPRLPEIVSRDIALLGRLVAWINRRYPAANENADWEGMLEEFAGTIAEEMDYAAEARNADRFRRNFREWRAVHVPRIHWTHTTRGVVTMEFIRGTKVTDVENLRARRISPVKVNRLLIQTYLKQLLEDGFFHADPHPGNLLVMDDGRLAFFDFGMTGRITPRLQAQMIDAFFHVVEKDVRGLAQDLIDLDFLKPDVSADTVRPVIEALFTQYLNLKLGEVKFKELTYDLAEVIYDYPFRLPSNFTFVMRALMTLEGIGIATDPGFNFFETAKPYAKDFMLRREGRQFRRLVLDRLTGRRADDESRVEWGKMWKLAKMAARAYLVK